MGGLVDVEFLTQMLQLKHGQRFREVRRQATLDALRALHERKLIGATEYRVLSDGYLFLRRLDHRLRLERQQSIDILERDPAKIQSIALALGYKGKNNFRAGERLLEDYEKVRERIRACYEKCFRSENGNRSTDVAGSAEGAPVSPAQDSIQNTRIDRS
jgi:glutamate-ammonia-ligase adenylyltransferase